MLHTVQALIYCRYKCIADINVLLPTVLHVLLNTYSNEKSFQESLLSVPQDIWKKEIRVNLDYMSSGVYTTPRWTKKILPCNFDG
jgi:hypothetical protein